MSEWEYVKGGPENFFGFSDQVVKVIKLEDTGRNIGVDDAPFKNSIPGELIAERRKLHNLQSRVNDTNLQQAFDKVQRPAHYNQSGIECIEAIAAAVKGKSGIEASLVGNVIKYLWRYELKSGVEDVQKAQWYLDRLMKELSK